MMIIDTHAHYNDKAFDEDRDELLSRMQPSGIDRIVNVSSGMKSVFETLDLMKKYDFIYGALGVHPEELDNMQDSDLETIRANCSQEKVVAIGEIGLDYYYDELNKDIQKTWFTKQLELAKDLDMPVIIHSRDACKDTLDILKQYDTVKGIIHCYSYSRETARDYLDMGYVFGIGGVITFKNSAKLQEAVKYIPIDRIVLETDCPYLSPVPNRGKRNSSLNIPYVIEKIAEVKEMDKEEVEKICYDNSLRVYRMV